MPTYQRFEDLPVWQSAAQLYERCDDFITAASPHLRPSTRDQLERAVLSVSNNIAEGFERGTTNELLAFIYIARGSAGEVRSMLVLLSRRPWAQNLKSDDLKSESPKSESLKFENFKSQISDLITLAESCSRQLRAWADSLQNSAITGPRHLNEHSRASYQKRQSREAGAAKFQALLAQSLPAGHPARPKS